MQSLKSFFGKKNNANTKDAVERANQYKAKYETILKMSGQELQEKIENNVYASQQLIAEYESIVKKIILVKLVQKEKNELKDKIIDLYLKARNRIIDTENRLRTEFRASMPAPPITLPGYGQSIASSLQTRLNAMRTPHGGKRRTHKKRGVRKTRKHRRHTRKH